MTPQTTITTGSTTEKNGATTIMTTKEMPTTTTRQPRVTRPNTKSNPTTTRTPSIEILLPEMKTKTSIQAKHTANSTITSTTTSRLALEMTTRKLRTSTIPTKPTTITDGKYVCRII